MKPLDYRHRLMEQALRHYRALETTTDPAQRREHDRRLEALLREIRTIENSRVSVGRQFTAYHREQRQSDPDQPEHEHDYLYKRYLRDDEHLRVFDRHELERLIGGLGYAEQSSQLRRQRHRRATLLHRLDALMAKLELLDDNTTALHFRNPFAEWSRNLFRYRVEDNLRAKSWRSSLAEYVAEQDQWAQEYAEGGEPHYNLDCLPLFQYDDIVDEWVELERKRLASSSEHSTPFRPRRLAELVECRFCQSDGRKLWDYVQRIADDVDRFGHTLEQLEGDVEHHRQLSVGSRAANFARHHLDDNRSSVVNALQAPPATVRPQFVGANGRPCRNTQVLCWRYHPQRPDQLGNMALDSHVHGLYTVALLYLDDDGYPTLQKPDFLQKREHDVRLQVNPENGNVLLLERSTGKRPDTPQVQDPLTATWHSYAAPDHLAMMRQAVQAVTDNDTLDEDTLFRASLDKLGMTEDGRLGADLCDVDLAGFFELTAGYTYGFMPLPLGYGSLSIQAVHTLFDAQDGNLPVCAKEEVTEDTDRIQLPRTLRQLTHELTQCRESIQHHYERLMDVSIKKRTDLAMVGDLWQWTQNTIQTPFNPNERNLQAKQELADLLRDLQQGIRETIFEPPFKPEMEHSDDINKRRLYRYQADCKAAADAYRLACKEAFSYLEDAEASQRIAEWRNRQEGIDEAYQNEWAGWLDGASEYFGKSRTAFVYPEPIPQSIWATPVSYVRSISAPYSSLVFEAYGGLLTQMAINYREPLVDKDGERINTDDSDLLDDYLLPALSAGVDQETLKSLIEFIRNVSIEELGQENSGFLAGSLDDDRASHFNTHDDSSVLSELIGFGSDTFKQTFLRGPGAPALAQVVIDLAGQLVKTRYAVDMKVQTQLSVRLYSLQLYYTVQLSVSRHRNALGRLVYRTLRHDNPVKLDRILRAGQLSNRVYGDDTFGDPKARLVRYEAYIKSAVFLWDATRTLLEFMNVMDPKHWDEPDPAAFRSAAYRLATKAEEGAYTAAGLLTVPAMMRFWSRKLGGDDARIARYLEREVGKNVVALSQRVLGTHGSRMTRWLVGAKGTAQLAGRSGLASLWANRLCVAASTLAFARNLMDIGDSHSRGDEDEMIGNTLMAIANGATVAGFALSTPALVSMAGLAGVSVIPVIGKVLFIGGLVVTAGMAGWNIYWQHYGRAQWYSNTYAVFDDRWEGFTTQDHIEEYRNDDCGAPAQLSNVIRNIERQHKYTLVDAVQGMTDTLSSLYRLHPNAAFGVGYALSRMFNTSPPEKPEDRAHVSWEELSWCAAAVLMEQNRDWQEDTNKIDPMKARECFDLTRAECEWLYQYENGTDENPNPTLPENWEDLKDNLKITLQGLLMQLRHEARRQPGGPLDRLIWQPLATDGRFPAEYYRADLQRIEFPRSFYRVEPLSEQERVNWIAMGHEPNSIPYARDVLKPSVGRFLSLWEERSQSVPRVESRHEPDLPSEEDEDQ